MATLREMTEPGVGFVSLTEALDLTSPAGRGTSGMLATFAGSAGTSEIAQLRRVILW